MQSDSLWPLIVYFFTVIVLITVLLALSYILGQRTKGRATGEIFESGIVPIGYARFRVPAKFYLVAMFFVIFDLEAVFIFAWAIALREAGWAGYVEILIFIAILVAALIYLWRVGALDWAPREPRLRLPTQDTREKGNAMAVE